MLAWHSSSATCQTRLHLNVPRAKHVSAQPEDVMSCVQACLIWGDFPFSSKEPPDHLSEVMGSEIHYSIPMFALVTGAFCEKVWYFNLLFLQLRDNSFKDKILYCVLTSNPQIPSCPCLFTPKGIILT